MVVAEQVSSPPVSLSQPPSAPTEQVDQVRSRKKAAEQATISTKCTFSGVEVPIDLKRFLEGGVTLVECPHCAATRTLEPHGRVLRAVVSRQTQNDDSHYRTTMGQGGNGLGRGWRREKQRKQKKEKKKRKQHDRNQ